MCPARTRNPAAPSPELLGRLRSALGPEGLLTAPAALIPYETDAMPIHRGRPLLVLLPRDETALLAALRILHEARIPWVARGAGTGLSGGAVPAPGRAVAVVSLARLRRILEIRPEQGRARVEPGVVNLALNEALAAHGLHFAPDPASQRVSTIGGNIAENAGGPRALKYGVTGHHVLGLRVALGDGTILRLGGDEETSPGYDLLGFFIGSEGTLGCVLEATVRAMPRPEAARVFLAAFPTVTAAAGAVGAILRTGVVPAALELIDALGLRTVTEAFALDLPRDAGALLLGEVDGLAETVAAEIELVTASLRASGATELRLAATPEERERLWSARRLVFGALGRSAPAYLQHDAAIPRSALPDVLARIVEVSQRAGLPIANVFHAGDGNIHPAVLYDDRVPGERERAIEVEREVARICLAAGGVLSGEHGIGLAKRDELPWIFSEAEIHLMHRLRLSFDATGRVNPDKLLPIRAPLDEADLTDEEAVGPVRIARSLHSGPSDADAAPSGPVGDGAQGPRRELTPPERAIVAMLAEARETKTHVVPIGGGTLIGWPVPRAGEPGLAQGPEDGPDAPPRVLETWAADRVVRFDPDDFALTVEAGVTLANAERVAAEAGQRLIWEAPDPEQATLGGIVSAGYWSSLSTGCGHPKHSLLGFRAITGEGQLIVFGGRVVRNVTGYDLGKLLVGARGTLAVLTQLTLRTYPRPARRVLGVIAGDQARLIALAEGLGRLALGWSAIDLFLRDGHGHLLVGLDGFEGEVQRRREALVAQLAATGFGDGPAAEIVCDSAADAAHRRRVDELGWRGSPLVLRVVVPPGNARAAVERVAGACAAGPEGAWSCAIHAAPAVGLLRVVFASPYEEVPLRRLLLDLATIVREAGGYRAIDRAPSQPWWGWDVWGVPALVRDRMRRIQAAMDPRGVLAPWTGA